MARDCHTPSSIHILTSVSFEFVETDNLRSAFGLIKVNILADTADGSCNCVVSYP